MQTLGEPNRMSALPPKPDIRIAHRHVRFGPNSDNRLAIVTDRQTNRLRPSILKNFCAKIRRDGHPGGSIVKAVSLI
jgi:hypothetical protein